MLELNPSFVLFLHSAHLWWSSIGPKWILLVNGQFMEILWVPSKVVKGWLACNIDEMSFTPFLAFLYGQQPTNNTKYFWILTMQKLKLTAHLAQNLRISATANSVLEFNAKRPQANVFLIAQYFYYKSSSYCFKTRADPFVYSSESWSSFQHVNMS